MARIVRAPPPESAAIARAVEQRASVSAERRERLWWGAPDDPRLLLAPHRGAAGGPRGAGGAGGAGPFEPVPVVVPNRNIEAYLKLGLAQARGIAANLEIALLRELLARLALRAVPGARLVTVRQLEGYLLALLGSADRDPALAPVWAYLGQ